MKSLRKRLWDTEKPVLGIMTFDASRLMSKVVHIWHCLSDRQMQRVREYVASSIGIKKLVSDDQDYLMSLALAEIIDTFAAVAKSAAFLGKKCTEPIYHNLEGIFDDPSDQPRWYKWQYRPEKMEKRVRKMSRFVAATEELYSEMEVLSEHERSLRQLKASANPRKAKMSEFKQKVELHQQLVKDLQEISPWVRAYDYVVRLLFRSLSTIMERIRHVSSVGQSGRHLSASLGRSFSNVGSPSSAVQRSRRNQMKVGRFPTVSFNGCVTGGMGSPFVDSSFRSNGASSTHFGEVKDWTFSPISKLGKAAFFDSRRRLLVRPPPNTVGDAALAFHYANLILLIENFAMLARPIDPDERDDLYDMLTANLRKGFRAEAKRFAGYRGSFEEWNSAVARTLEWISPLARNTVRWQNERGFERPRSSPAGSGLLLVQTLYFADRDAAEAAIVRLLVGLNFLARFQESSCDRWTSGNKDEEWA